jgi:SAP domain-containing ribonucleoprotein
MADYGVLKVQDLKKLLQERNLATTGNKPDLIKRLQDADRDAEASGTAAAAPGMLSSAIEPITSSRFPA